MTFCCLFFGYYFIYITYHIWNEKNLPRTPAQQKFYDDLEKKSKENQVVK